ncbi:MAG: metallophosphoesterase [Polyangiales bacterium]
MLSWATDVHLDFLEDDERRAFARSVAATGCEGLLLTGDISDHRALARHLVELADAIDAPVWFVLGNHDYYHGSVASGREAVRALARRFTRLVWLHDADVLTLRPDVALVGVDGWGDARLGAPDTTPILLNDFRLIEELAWLSIDARNAALRAFGDESARVLERKLATALEGHARVIVATHVPPFREACWHEGALSGDEWLPFFTCHAVGEVLLRAADAQPSRRIEVYCGHTHSPGIAHLRDNLVVHTGGAEYGRPAVAGRIVI